MAGKKASKQPYAYAKQGEDGRWYHWTNFVGPLARGAAFGLGAAVFGWLFGSGGLGISGLTGDIVKEVKDWFKL